ncbi:ribbon-helix-helix domain-containing protein [Yoonia sp. 2307UL14-13]|uniref:ribbon-helix-helix domain-containing protein n=1 Tax=Yoonia sp. 2307UL14-13 TaxID=3126506 RepID=UPI00309BB469
MPRQTITLTDPNYAWLQARVESGEFRSQTEAVNDALRRVRETEAYRETPEEIAFIREKLERAAKSGYSTLTPEEILEKSKAELRRNGEL